MFLSAASLLVHAQKTKDNIDYKTAITFNPSMLLSIDYCFMAGAEYRIKPKMVLALEAGYIFASDKIGNWQNNQNQGQNQKATGFIIRPAIKFFVNEKNTFYFQPQMFYKQVTHHLYDWLGKDVVNGVASYEQLPGMMP